MARRYPQIVDYHEAVQNPASAFRDAELRQGRIEVNALGLPVALSGGFALTYMMRTPRGKLAVRCFLREIPAVQQKYAAIAGAFRALDSAYFVDFEYLADGITLHGLAWPVVKMDWAEGETLGVWLERNHANARALTALRQAFAELASYLERHGIGHGDIQTGNVIVSPTGSSRAALRLVDYDGVYVPGMPAEFGCECGHRHFQHPLRTTAQFGPSVDRFSFIVVDLSLAALIEDPSIYQRFCRGGEAVIFHAADFADPAGSALFQAIARYRRLAAAAGDFAAICRAEIAAVPTLAEFRAGRNIPRSAAPPSPAAAPPRRAGSPNRHLVARLLGNGPVEPHAMAAPPAVPTVDNSAILQRLQAAAPQPPLPPRPAPPRGVPQALRPLSRPAPRPAARPISTPPSPPTPPAPRIPKRGSFVIHPRQRGPAPPPPSPTPWQRLLRFLGIG